MSWESIAAGRAAVAEADSVEKYFLEKEFGHEHATHSSIGVPPSQSLSMLEEAPQPQLEA